MKTSKTKVLYDGHCNFCTRSARMAKLLDWLHKIEWIDFHDKKALKEFPNPPSLKALNKEMCLVGVDGKQLKGFFAWRRILKTLPLTFVFHFVLYLPPFPQIGQIIYKRIAKNRSCRDDRKCKI